MRWCVARAAFPDPGLTPPQGSQAEFIFSCAWEVMKYADMHTKGISLIHLYDEGSDLDFNVGLCATSPPRPARPRSGLD